jgi:hypothetical protein
MRNDIAPRPRKPGQRQTVMDDLRLARNKNATRPAGPAGKGARPGKIEIVTDFISLTQGYTLGMAEGGQLVRVELPRSALSSFGLPVNAARLDEPVKADVVMGNDGIARAIRFVR